MNFKYFQLVGYAVACLSLTGFSWPSASDDKKDVPYEEYYPKWMQDFRFDGQAPVATEGGDGYQQYNLSMRFKRLGYLEEDLQEQFKRYCKAAGGTAKLAYLSRCLSADDQTLGGYTLGAQMVAGDSSTTSYITHYSGKHIEDGDRRNRAYAERRKKFVGTNGPTGTIHFPSGEKVIVVRFGTRAAPEEYVVSPQNKMLTEIKQLVSEKQANGSCRWHAELWDGTSIRDIRDIGYYSAPDKDGRIMTGRLNYLAVNNEGGLTEKKLDCFSLAKVTLDSTPRAGAPSDNRFVNAAVGATPAELKALQAKEADAATKRAIQLVSNLNRAGKMKFIPTKLNGEMMNRLYGRGGVYGCSTYTENPQKKAECMQANHEESLIKQGMDISVEMTPMTADWYYNYWTVKLGLNK